MQPPSTAVARPLCRPRPTTSVLPATVTAAAIQLALQLTLSITALLPPPKASERVAQPPKPLLLLSPSSSLLQRLSIKLKVSGAP